MYFVFVHPDCNKYEPVLVYVSTHFRKAKEFVRFLSDQKDIQCDEHVPVQVNRLVRFYDRPIEICEGEQPFAVIIDMAGPENASRAMGEMKRQIV
jgi:hypothetical protein